MYIEEETYYLDLEEPDEGFERDEEDLLDEIDL